MDSSWFTTTIDVVPAILLTALSIYLALMVCTRIAGLRSFSKLSSFDFAITVAIGSLIASTILTEDPPLLQSFVALASLYALQMGVGALRIWVPWFASLVDNQPLLLMRGSEFLEANMRRAKITRGDILAKLREANVTQLDQVLAVVMESTGDVSVLHGDEDSALQPELLENVEGP